MVDNTTKMKTYQKLGWMFLLTVLLHISDARKHKLKLEKDSRSEFPVSTFGFLKGGSLKVNVTKFIYSEKDNSDVMIGFVLEKSSNSGMGQYLDNPTECVFKNLTPNEEKEDSIVFIMDFKESVMRLKRFGDGVANLTITAEALPKKAISKDITKRDIDGDIVRKFFNEVSLSRRRKRAPSNKVFTTEGKSLTKATILPTTVDIITTKSSQINNASLPTSNLSSPTAAPPLSDDTDAAKTQRAEIPAQNLISMKKNENGAYQMHFTVLIKEEADEGLYNLVFHSCASKGTIDLIVEIEERNNEDYLSAGQMPLPILYFSISILFFLAGCLWIVILRSSKDSVYKMHYLMSAVVFTKSISLLFHGINYHYIRIFGIHEEMWAILYYIVYLMRGALLFTTIVLIGAGWVFIKHMLSNKEKKLFLIVIPLQVLGNIAWIIIEESEEGQVQYTRWKTVFFVIDLFCCGAIMFPVVWSIRHLQEASNTDGKAAINLIKLKLFRRFYIMVVCYIYFTRIIVYLLKYTIPFKYEYINEMFKELGTFVFLVVTGYMFRPASDNPYLQVPQESDEEMEMDEVLTKSGVLDTVVKVGYRVTNGNNTVPKQRESSHEYD